jgi:hypothetical protein
MSLPVAGKCGMSDLSPRTELKTPITNPTQPFTSQIDH